MSEDPLAGVPTRAQIAEIILRPRPHRDTFEGWQHYRATRHLLVPPPRITPAQWGRLEPGRRADLDLFRRLTNVNLPLQQTPMSAKVARVINRRLHGNALNQGSPTLPGIMVSGPGNHGKTATVSSVCAAFEDMWLDLHQHLNPASVEGTLDLHAPIAFVQIPVTATPKSLCESILNFFSTERRKMTLPQLIRQVADSLRDHGVRALVLDDINRLRMHRADDQDVLDLVRALMGFQVTLILTGVNIPGLGLLREARRDARTRQWVLPPLESARVHGLEVTQTERRFEMVELDHFRYDTPQAIQDFTDHLQGIENHLRLLKAKKGMLTSGTMPEYLMRRSGGVVGILGRLITDGAQEAMDSGTERLDEALLDGIVIGREEPAEPAAAHDQAAEPASAKPRPGRARGRNTVFDDHGPQATPAAG
ncbi:TniB family NTP-binding protein [Kitasatospora sp. NPDC096077]|uniref:AAA family ATPase n=1 Tax=Kitasatospora sp. NPDC096077 TaxID=3155544 RepID=UPI0033235CA6